MLYIAFSSTGQERQLSADEARQEGSFLIRRYCGDSVAETESFRDGVLEWVRYIDHPWPNEGLLARHRSDHGKVPFEVTAPLSGQSGTFRREVFCINAQGLLAERDVYDLDDDGNPVGETRFEADGRWLEHTVYKSTDSGLMMRRVDQEGRPISEWE